MAKEGLPAAGADTDSLDASGLRLAVVTATWNEEICDRLHERALAAGRAAGGQGTLVQAVADLLVPGGGDHREAQSARVERVGVGAGGGQSFLGHGVSYSPRFTGWAASQSATAGRSWPMRSRLVRR